MTRVQMSQAAGTEQMIPRLSRYSSESGRKLNSSLIIKLINIAVRYGFGPGSGSFYNQAKIVRKTLIPTVL
jgi:hypothetical protein